MLEEKEIDIDGSKYIISKLPATVGREIFCKYPLTALPKIGDYPQNEEAMLKLMGYVQVEVTAIDSQSENKKIKIPFVNVATINKYIKGNEKESWEILGSLEIAMLEYNCSFLKKGLASTFLEKLKSMVQVGATKILTDSLAQLFPKEKQP